MHIAVLGAGSWGTTLSILLSENGHTVTLWSFLEKEALHIRDTRENPDFLPGVHIPQTIHVTRDILEAVAGAQMIVGAVPSQHLRSVMAHLRAVPLHDVLMVNVAKGIENGTLMTMSEMLHDTLPDLDPQHVTTLSGPSHAEEVSRRIPTAVVAASLNHDNAKIVQRTFMLPYFRVYVSTDLRGVEMGGALKNVIAIAAGIIDGANLGDNTKAAVMTRGIAEIARIGVALGARIHTFAGLSGIGDLMVTCMSRQSRNRFIGVEIGKGRKLKEILSGMVMIAEGIDTTQSAYDLSRKVGVEVPIIEQVHRVLFEDKDPLQACRDLMTRDPKCEV